MKKKELVIKENYCITDEVLSFEHYRYQPSSTSCSENDDAFAPPPPAGHLDDPAALPPLPPLCDWDDHGPPPAAAEQLPATVADHWEVDPFRGDWPFW